ncbi:hypothetical protein SAMN06295967_105194 [Belliella buryatensis]|uniref:Uncharacterized protein n=1 Tax=Belliella buryatensis TaxID=1500549 RepID=A0A239CRJ5_9BACT|nr:hypothetical protein SAMN06295967_105194 [Belliella buryatensis]
MQDARHKTKDTRQKTQDVRHKMQDARQKKQQKAEPCNRVTIRNSTQLHNYSFNPLA